MKLLARLTKPHLNFLHNWCFAAVGGIREIDGQAELFTFAKNIFMEDLKPCPFCGQPVQSHEEKSPDGTIIWVRITHGPTIPCGIFFLDIKSDAVKKWNNRVLL